MSRWSGSTYNVKKNVKCQDGWMECDIRKLVSLYRRNPCLWKRDDQFYLDGERRYRAYERIQRDMKFCGDPDGTRVSTFVEIMMKLREIRKLYVTELTKVLESESTCCRYEPTAKWFYELHDFLYPYLDYDETLELHCIADRSITEVSHEYSRSKSPISSSPSKILQREVTSKADEGSTDALVKYKSPRISKCKAISSGVGSHRGSSTPCTTRLTYRAPNILMSCSSGDSATGFASSCSNMNIGSSTSTVICDNRIAYRCGSSSETYEPDDESLENWTSSNLKNKPISRTNHLFTNEKLQGLVEFDNFEIFANQVACQLRKMKLSQALQAQTAIQKILNDRVIRPNVNANTNTKRNPVSHARTVSRTFEPCSISICRRHDFTSPMERVGEVHTTNERFPQSKYRSRSHEGSTGRFRGSGWSSKNRWSFRQPSHCSELKRPCTRR